jgi:hypothetical protein
MTALPGGESTQGGPFWHNGPADVALEVWDADPVPLYDV